MAIVIRAEDLAFSDTSPPDENILLVRAKLPQALLDILSDVLHRQAPPPVRGGAPEALIEEGEPTWEDAEWQ